MVGFTSLAAIEEYIFSKLTDDILLATPLGLGKPNQLLNSIYNRIKKEPSRKLKIFTALSLDIPDAKTDLEARFTRPFFQRHFGENYPRLNYVQDLLAKKLPSNIKVEEFYFLAGKYLQNSEAQSHYISLNYTHVAQNIYESGVNLIVQLIAKSADGRYSLSCNPDLTLDVADLYKKQGQPLMVVGVVHPELPFLGGDAEVPADFFAAVLESPEIQHTLFSPPKAAIDPTEYLIGLHASHLIPDDGTLQIGIGSLAEALVYSTLLRHQNNDLYVQMLENFWRGKQKPDRTTYFTQGFQKGLYGTSEMLMDGFMHLRKAGILIRHIFDRDENAKRYLHGAFFLGSKDFYQWLRGLQGEDFQGLSMTRVSKVNDLYDAHEMALRHQRKRARFFNTCMSVTLLGGAASETLENGQVISGVGGQYNFVAMSHELPDSHSVLMMRSTRTHEGQKTSNIIWSQGHLTIPRHLRDIVITEYGIATLKGKNDEDVIKQLLNITDSGFQEELLQTAKANRKISADYEIPEWAQNNYPHTVKQFVQDYQKQNLFPDYPNGSDFTPVEEKLSGALLQLKDSSKKLLVGFLMKGFVTSKEIYAEELKRMGLFETSSWKDRIYQKVLLGALSGL